MTGTNSVSVMAPSDLLCGGVLVLARMGNSATKRAAIVLASRCSEVPSGSAAINEVNLSVAVSPGKSANLAASCQGSMSNRANAERTLSSIPFLSSPTGANRNSSNSDPRLETAEEWVISTTGLDRLHRTNIIGDAACGGSAAHSETKPYWTAARRVRLGNYSGSCTRIRFCR